MDKLKSFKQIEGWNGNYYIDNAGQIFSINKNDFIAQPIINEHYCVNLCLSGSKFKKLMRVDSLVAEYYLPKASGEYNKILHIDGDNMNNNVENLKRCTRNELNKHNADFKKIELLSTELKGYKSITNYNDFYYINNKGKIYSFYLNKFMKPNLTDDGYHTIMLGQRNKKKKHYIHRIVAELFLQKNNDKNKTVVNHIDGNKINNSFKNLEWCTPSENNKHCHETGLASKPTYNHVYHQLDVNHKIIQTFKTIVEILEQFNNGKKSKSIHNAIQTYSEWKGYFWIKDYNNTDIKNEIWKNAKTGTGIDEFVVVSNFGRVKNSATGHVYKQNENGKYISVSIGSKNDDKTKKLSYSVSRLVAQSFLDNKIGKDAHINHIDKNSLNNNVKNLEWICPKKHMLKDHAIAVASSDDDENIIKSYNSIKEAAEDIGCDAGRISNALWTGYKCKGYYWKRL